MTLFRTFANQTLHGLSKPKKCGLRALVLVLSVFGLVGVCPLMLEALQSPSSPLHISSYQETSNTKPKLLTNTQTSTSKVLGVEKGLSKWMLLWIASLAVVITSMVMCAVFVLPSAIQPVDLVGGQDEEEASTIAMSPNPNDDNVEASVTVGLETITAIVGTIATLVGIVVGRCVLKHKGNLRCCPCRRVIAIYNNERYLFEYSKVSFQQRSLTITRLYDDGKGNKDFCKLTPYYWNITHDYQTLFSRPFTDSICITLPSNEYRLKKEMTFYEYINEHVIPRHSMQVRFVCDDDDEFIIDPPKKPFVKHNHDALMVVDEDKGDDDLFGMTDQSSLDADDDDQHNNNDPNLKNITLESLDMND